MVSWGKTDFWQLWSQTATSEIRTIKETNQKSKSCKGKKTHHTNHEHTHELFITASLPAVFTFFPPNHAPLISSDNPPLAITLFLSHTKLLNLNRYTQIIVFEQL